jgi:hypothetical protein
MPVPPSWIAGILKSRSEAFCDFLECRIVLAMIEAILVAARRQQGRRLSAMPDWRGVPTQP